MTEKHLAALIDAGLDPEWLRSTLGYYRLDFARLIGPGNALDDELLSLLFRLRDLYAEQAPRRERDGIVSQLRNRMRRFQEAENPSYEKPKRKESTKHKRPKVPSPIKDVLGVVVFVAEDKSHGYVRRFESISHSGDITFQEHKGSSLNGTNIKSGISKGDILVYEQKGPPESTRAVNIGKQIPMYVAQVAGKRHSIGFPLIAGCLDRAIPLARIKTSGFIVYTIHTRNFVSGDFALPQVIPCREEDIHHFGPQILDILIVQRSEYGTAAQGLVKSLEEAGASDAVKAVFQAHIDIVRGQPLAAVTQVLKELIQLGLPNTVILEEGNRISRISLALWDLNQLEHLPLPTDQKTEVQWRQEILPACTWRQLQRIILALNGVPNGAMFTQMAEQQLLGIGWEIFSDQDLEIIIGFFKTYTWISPELNIGETAFQCQDPAAYIALWQQGILPFPSFEKVHAYIKSLSTEREKIQFIEELLEADLHRHYQAIPSLAERYTAYLKQRISILFAKLAVLTIDIESDGQEISEIAWVLDGQSTVGYSKRSGQMPSATIVRELFESGRVVVGHNIKEFDLPILARRMGVDSPAHIWDTLEIELLLNPLRGSFALQTQHTAVEDATLADRLFRNQLARICKEPRCLEWLAPFLPVVIIDRLHAIMADGIWEHLPSIKLEEDADSHFRPAPQTMPLPAEALQAIQEHLQPAHLNVLIAPRIIWPALASEFQLAFGDARDAYAHVLDSELVQNNLDDEPFLKAVLQRHVAAKSAIGQIPYWATVPMPIQLRLGVERFKNVCRDTSRFFLQSSVGIYCIAPYEVALMDEILAAQTHVNFLLIAEELGKLTSKYPLGEPFDAAFLFDRTKQDPGIWMQMSGGKKVIPITQQQCALLDVGEHPPFLHNQWIEKLGRSQYRIWGAVSLDKFFDARGLGRVHRISWEFDSVEGRNVAMALPSPNGRFDNASKRVNPGSLFRSTYWACQFKLMTGSASRPKIWVVNEKAEIDGLVSLAQAHNCYVPDRGASLARQLELLHASHPRPCLIIAHLEDLIRVIELNGHRSIDIIWDSFELDDAKMILGPQVLNGSESETLYDPEGEKAAYSTYRSEYGLILNYKVLVDFYAALACHYHPDSRVLLHDPRFTDYPRIEKKLGAKLHLIPMWVSEEEFQADLKTARQIFGGNVTEPNADFDVEEAMEVIRQIFLPKDKAGQSYAWRDYQNTHLRAILPALQDLLISLPTGAGKSVLFQGPSLFRSAFTNKLSIVISPLKALITDQVNSLQNEKRFYSNVGSLNSDQSYLENRDTLRRVAGGEITLLYVTPERFRSRPFINAFLARLSEDQGMEFAIFDEAHCISQWGQEFRPDYLSAARRIAELKRRYNAKVLLFSATISEQVFGEITQLVPGVNTVDGAEKSYNPVRDHITIEFEGVNSEDRLPQVAQYLRERDYDPSLSRAIVFVRSRANTEDFALAMPEVLNAIYKSGCPFADKIGSFHAGMDADDRQEVYEKFKSGDIVLLFATKAFGMGMDISNIHYLCHYSPPGVFEDFLQEVGRAGRDQQSRESAGFTAEGKVLKTKCLVSPGDFGKQKDLLHKSRIAWIDVKEVQKLIERYFARFRSKIVNDKFPIAVPQNLYAMEHDGGDGDSATKFRLGLHWLEKLGKIQLGYFAPTHLEFNAESVPMLRRSIGAATDATLRENLQAMLECITQVEEAASYILVSIAKLQSRLRLVGPQLINLLMEYHQAGHLKLEQSVHIECTKVREDEIRSVNTPSPNIGEFPALKVIFQFAREILNQVKPHEEQLLEGEWIDHLLKELVDAEKAKGSPAWVASLLQNRQAPSREKYWADILKKRAKHAFTILRCLTAVKHKSVFETTLDSSSKHEVRQSVYNGFPTMKAAQAELNLLEEGCLKVLMLVKEGNYRGNKKRFELSDLAKAFQLKPDIKQINDVLYILSVLGYSRFGSLLPTGIEVYLFDDTPIDEEEKGSKDSDVFTEFEVVKRIRELKLIAMEVFSKMADVRNGGNKTTLDTFIKRYFACASEQDLIGLLESELDPSDPILSRFRETAIKEEEGRLNLAQRAVYDAAIDQHINVIAGPGSGKTHTLTLRVARLVHHIGVPPSEILVLAYNRAVVLELKSRLGSLLAKLGYDSLGKGLGITTFHGLALRCCRREVEEKPFEEWEPILLEQLKKNPGYVMQKLGSLQHILIDEFQDIDDTRIDILEQLLNQTRAKLFIIGDPNQSIYGYARTTMSPWPYYKKFEQKFTPLKLLLRANYRSYPKILELAKDVLKLPSQHQDLIPLPHWHPSPDFIPNYAEEIDTLGDGKQRTWWNEIPGLLQESVDGRPYRQIVVLFRSNEEVFRGYQRLIGLNLNDVQVRIQGKQEYDLSRTRECFAILEALKKVPAFKIERNMAGEARQLIEDLVKRYPHWNHFTSGLVYAAILEYVEEEEEDQSFEAFSAFFEEMSGKDDGQLAKIYYKHREKMPWEDRARTEIVLTTMHKVKGLEYDAVIIPPSFADLPFSIKTTPIVPTLPDYIEEERRLTFVAYTRARYRLLAFMGARETALTAGQPYHLPAQQRERMGTRLPEGLEKLYLGWGATLHGFQYHPSQEIIASSVKRGDQVIIKMGLVNLNPAYLIYKADRLQVPIGCLSSAGARRLEAHFSWTGFMVSEVIVWTYAETLEADARRGTTYANHWCPAAREKGYIYVVDIIGYGASQDNLATSL